MYQTRDHRQAAMQALQGASNTTARMMKDIPEKKANAADYAQGAMGAYMVYDEGKDLIGGPEESVSEEILVSDIPANDPIVVDNMATVSATGEHGWAPGVTEAEKIAMSEMPIQPGATAVEGGAMVEGAAPVAEAAMPAAGGAVETAAAGTTAVTEGVAAGTALAKGAVVAEGAVAAETAVAATAAAETAAATTAATAAAAEGAVAAGSMAGPVGAAVAIGAVAIGSLLF